MPRKGEQSSTISADAKSAETLRDLRRRWPEAQAKRAMGGWWALSGFTFQMLVALNQFLKDNLLETSATAIGVEDLSDILLADADEYRLTQVKRTLTNSTLSAAIREAYEILKLAEEPLRGQLVFQIVCQDDQTTRGVAACTAEQVFSAKAHDKDVFAKTLKRFNQTDPVLVAAHPANALLQTLWNAGVENPVATMARALGYIFAAFDGQVREQMQSGVLEALDSIRTSIKSPRVVGRLLGADDFAIRSTSAPHRIAFDSRPRLEDLTLNRFLQRTERMAALEGGAAKWLADVPRELMQYSSQLPIFWIEGHQGDGKSVALLQMVERLLLSRRLASVTELLDIDEFKTWLETRVAVSHLGDELPVDVAFIDDLPAFTDPEVLNSLIDSVCYRGDRAAALLTCGTSDQLGNFRAISKAKFATFVVRPPDGRELEMFRDWLEDRTGQTVEKLELGDTSLAAWLFESVNASKKELPGATLRQKLEQQGLLEVAKTAAALNACGIPAPRSLFEEGAIERLSDIFAEPSDLVALNLVAFRDGIRIGHSEAIQSLYNSWSEGKIAQQLGADLGFGLRAICEEGNERLARQLLGQLMDRKYLRRRFGLDATELVDFSQAIWDRSSDLPLKSRASVLPLWLTLGKAKRLSPQLLADLRRDAVAVLGERGVSERLRAEIASVLYVMSNQGDADRSAAEATILASVDPKVISLLKKSCEKRTDNKVPELVASWLKKHPDEPLAAIPLQQLLSKPDDKIVDLALDFVERHMSQARSGDVLWSVALGSVRTRRFYPIVDKWLSVAPDPTTAARLFTRQLRGRNGEDYVTRALLWVRRNMSVKGIHEVLAALVAKAPGDQEITELARQWLLAYPPLSEANPLLLSMLKSHETRSEGFDFALDRLDKGVRDEAWGYLSHQVKEEALLMTSQDALDLEKRLPRGPANILRKMLRGPTRPVERPGGAVAQIPAEPSVVSSPASVRLRRTGG